MNNRTLAFWMRKICISEIVCCLEVVDFDYCVILCFLVPAGICHSEECSQSSRCVFNGVSKAQFDLPGKSFKFLLFRIIFILFFFFFASEGTLWKTNTQSFNECIFRFTQAPISVFSLSVSVWAGVFLLLVIVLLAGIGCLWEIIGIAFGALYLMFCIFIYFIM